MHNTAHETSRVNHEPWGHHAEWNLYWPNRQQYEYAANLHRLRHRRAVRLTLLTVGVAGLIVAAALAVGVMS